jgi:hypothetical protein
MRAGAEDRQSLLSRVGYGAMFLTVGVALVLRAYTLFEPDEQTSGLDLLVFGVTGLCSVIAGLGLLTHDPQDDACVDPSPSPRASRAATGGNSCPAAGVRLYRDVVRPRRPRRPLPPRPITHR